MLSVSGDSNEAGEFTTADMPSNNTLFSFYRAILEASMQVVANPTNAVDIEQYNTTTNARLKPSYLQLINYEDEPEPEPEIQEKYALTYYSTTEPEPEIVSTEEETSIWTEDVNIELEGMFYYVDKSNRGGQWWQFELNSAVKNGFITPSGSGKLYIYITSLNGYRLLCSLYNDSSFNEGLEYPGEKLTAVTAYSGITRRLVISYDLL